jgi:DNA-directed RNA polymerase specialized sigma24 family protein
MHAAVMEGSRMPFTAHDLRYNLQDNFSKLYAYLQQRAKRWLGTFAYDSDEVDIVVEHVIEQLTRLGLLGGGEHAPETALDRLSNAQFYAFLNQSVKNKAIDRLRRHRLPTSSLSAFEDPSNIEEENDPLNTVADSIWGSPPFATPEVAALQAASQEELRNLIKHCIEELGSAPRQLLAVIQELDKIGIKDLVQELKDEFRRQLADVELSHLSQHKDHAHKKLRHCLQHNSTNLAVLVALRLTEYRQNSTGIDKEILVDIKTLVYERMSGEEVLKGLSHLARVGLLDWHGEEVVRITSVQLKHLARFYEEGE